MFYSVIHCINHLFTRRARQEYGRDELYKWLSRFKVFETKGDCVKYAVGIVKKCKTLKIIDDFDEE